LCLFSFPYYILYHVFPLILLPVILNNLYLSSLSFLLSAPLLVLLILQHIIILWLFHLLSLNHQFLPPSTTLPW
jgi:Cu/Ag efflux pump CusA